MNSLASFELTESIQNYSQVAEDELKNISARIPQQNIFEYLNHKKNCIVADLISEDSKLAFLESYQKIRDASWPDLYSIEDFANLPEAIKKECIEIHNFSADIFFNQNITFSNFQPAGDWKLSPNTLLRFKSIVLDNQEYVTDKKVVEFCCSYGTISTTIMNLNPNSLIFTEVRPDTLRLAEEAMSILQVDSAKWKSSLSDIHDYATNTEICLNTDTVFLCGILYHVHDHYAILESIARARPTTIIIETRENQEIKDLPTPLVAFRTELTKNVLSGYEQDKQEILVGFPNTAWIDNTMTLLKYQKVKPTKFNHWTYDATDPIKEPEHYRSVHVYQRI